MARGRPDRVAIGFTIVWMTFWTSAILVAIWTLGAAALAGEPAAALFLAVWLAAAGFALVSVGRRLMRQLYGTPRLRRPHRNHRWNDGIDPPGPEA
jgi:membrane protein implicated in regulation of membrane protease activity